MKIQYLAIGLLLPMPLLADEIIDTLPVSKTSFKVLTDSVPSRSQAAFTLDRAELIALNPITIADALKNSGEVNVQQSQMGGGSPILRGFEANRILLVVDGIRMNNAIYRGGHLQSIITVDPMLLEKVDVLYGSNSLAYGSDALGGVIRMQTLSPKSSKNGLAYFQKAGRIAHQSSIGDGADWQPQDGQNQYHAEFMGGLGTQWPIGLLLSTTYTQRGDLRTGTWKPKGYEGWGLQPWIVQRMDNRDTVLANPDPYTQSPSGYDQMDFAAKAVWDMTSHKSLDLNTQFSTSTHIPRFDRLSEISSDKPTYAQWYYGPQDRLLLTLQFSDRLSNSLYDLAQWSLSYQSIGESRMSRKLNGKALKSQVESLDGLRIANDMSKKNTLGKLQLGWEAAGDYVRSKAWNDTLSNQAQGPTATRYPREGSQTQSFGVYTTQQIQLQSKLIADVGARWQYQYLTADFGNDPVMKFPFQKVTQHFNAWTGSTGVVWTSPLGVQTGALASTGFRAPNVDDLGKVFESEPGVLIVPNPELKPEYLWNGELFIKDEINPNLQWEIRGHRSWLDNAIVLMPTTWNDSTTILYEGKPTTPQHMSNASSALLWGFSAKASAKLPYHLQWDGATHKTWGVIDDASKTPLDHQSPLTWTTSLQWETTPTLSLQTKFLGTLSKPKSDYNIVGEDNFKFATADGLPGWWIQNVGLTYKFASKSQLQMGVENIFDAYYRQVGSGFGSAGRQLQLSIQTGL